MGHRDLYNKNQIRDKLFLVLIFLFRRGAAWQDYFTGLEKRCYMRKAAVSGV